MSIIHFLNVLEGDCNIIQHDTGRTTVIDICNGNHDESELGEILEKVDRLNTQRDRRFVPESKKDYQQKKTPDNPLEYLSNKLNINEIHRFIITHPDMDHLDGIKSLFSSFNILNTWDTDNNKKLSSFENFHGYRKEDWEFYESLRHEKFQNTRRLTYFDNTTPCQFWQEDHLTILAPSPQLLLEANESKNYNDASYVLLFTPPKKNGSNWKILLGGDSHSKTWEHILEKYSDLVTNIDFLIAPHHGRDSDMDFSFLKTLNPTVTLMGNASSNHLAYDKYPDHITNNQAGYVILNVDEESISVYVKNGEFAINYCKENSLGIPLYFESFDAFGLYQINA